MVEIINNKQNISIDIMQEIQYKNESGGFVKYNLRWLYYSSLKNMDLIG